MDQEEILVRKFTQEDSLELVSFWQSIFINSAAHNEPKRMLEEKLAVDDLIYIAKYKEHIIGACMAGYDGHRGWLYAVATSSDYRRLGVGTKLIQTSIEALRQLGCIKLNLQIRTDNTEVTRFYQSLGFNIEERLSMGKLI